MRKGVIGALAALAGTSAPVIGRQSATYSIAFGSPIGPNTVALSPGQSVSVYVNVAFSPPVGALATTPAGVTGTVLGLAGGGFSIELTGANFPIIWSAPALVFPYNTPPGSTGAGCYNLEGVLWDTGPLAAPPHPLPHNPGTVWTGNWTTGSSGFTNFMIADHAPTRVWVLPAGTSVPIEAVYQSVGGFAYALHGCCGPCYANCDGSLIPPFGQNSLTIADFACFQAKFAAGADYADCNKDCSLTIADFSCFQARFAAGCP